MEYDTLCNRVATPFLFDYRSSLPNASPCKKRKKFVSSSKFDGYLPVLSSEDYYTVPSLDGLAKMEEIEPGYCGKVRDFTIGRVGFGNVRFVGETDVRGLDLEEIVKFNRHEVVVYEDENVKPRIGEGLNKDAVVTLLLKVDMSEGFDGVRFGKVVDRLRFSADRQGAEFVSYEPGSGEWRFKVKHFSRFGLSLDDEDDIVMDDVGEEDDGVVMNGGVEDEDEDGGFVDDGFDMGVSGPELSHSLPAHLGLDPAKMREMRMMMFSGDGDENGDYDEIPSREELRAHREKSPFYNSGLRLNYKPSPPQPRKTPVPLLEYKSGNFDVNAPGTLLLSKQNKGLPFRLAKWKGFKLESNSETPVSGYHSRNIVDAGLFMGRSFRVGWGPNGVLIHSGTPVGGNDSRRILSSVITIQKVAIDKVARDKNNNVKKEAVDSLFDPLLDLHSSLSHKTEDIEIGSFKLGLRKIVCNPLALQGICRGYIDLVEKQADVSDLPDSVHLSFAHQVMVWELIKVLFGEGDNTTRLLSGVNGEEMLLDDKASESDLDLEALPLMRRAGFSFWLQESVYHRVQDDVSSLNESSDLEQVFFYLSGRQLEAAVELSASRGDVRLACLLSEAGGSMVNRSDIAQQLDLWRINGMDFKFVEKDRIRLYELLCGNIHSAANGKVIDWKRFLGLLMWYELSPETDLPAIFHTYQHLVAEKRAPFPVPAYIDEASTGETINTDMEGILDLAYHLMLLYASEGGKYDDVKSMFSAFASTNDPLDYHMIWHQRGILEAIDVVSSKDLHILDMAYVSQLLCLGKCHWAIYVALHMSYREDFPYLHSTVVREILFQYCETWSSSDEQRKFIEDLGIPSQWLHEAMAVYCQYNGDLPKALEHYIKCANWQKAHSIFITSVVHSLFLSAKDPEIWSLATSMENHKSEIEDWDLGAGVYIAFYLLRDSLQDGDNDMTKLVSLDSREAACREFFDQLNKSLGVLENKLPLDARVAYSKMSEEICSLLLSDGGQDSTYETRMKSFSTAATAPVPEDLRTCHLHEAVSLFTCFLTESAS